MYAFELVIFYILYLVPLRDALVLYREQYNLNYNKIRHIISSYFIISRDKFK